jgi:predicted Ser/Thr protein kinase
MGNTGSHDPEDVHFGRAAMARGLLSAEKIRDAIAEQARIAAAGEKLPLWAVLVRMGALAPRDVSVIRGGSSPSARHTAVPSKTPGPTPTPVTNTQRMRAIESVQPLLVIGALIGPWRLEEELGRGGMGVVFKARREGGEERVALKILRDPGRASLIERFVRETRAVARLEHPGIVRLVDSGKAGDLPYYAMELVPGKSLDAVLEAEERLEPRRAATLMRDVARAAHAAHEKGIVHRDLKPANVLLTATSEPKVTDFGLAKLEDEENKLTRTGAAVGTPAYMSPEQIHAGPIDRRSDIFALGVMLHELVMGDKPWTAESLAELFGKICETELPPIPGDPDLDRIVRKCCQKLPQDRYATAEELARDLDAWLGGGAVEAALPGVLKRTGRRIAARNQLLIGVAVGAVVVVPIALLARGRRVEERAPAPVVATVVTRTVVERRSEASSSSSADVGRERLAQVAEYRRGHPDDRRGALERYRAIVADLPDTDAAVLAGDEAKALELIVDKDEHAALDDLVATLRPKSRSDDIASSVVRLDTELASASWSAASKDRLRALLTEITNKGRATIDEIEKAGTDQAEKGDAASANLSLAELNALRLPASLEGDRKAAASRLEPRVAAAKDRQAARRAADAENARLAKEADEARAILADVVALESRGDLEGARTRLGTACLASSVVAARAEVERALGGRTALVSAVSRLELDLEGGVAGTVERLDDERLVLVLKPKKKGGPTEAPLTGAVFNKTRFASDDERAAVALYLIFRGRGEAALALAAGAGEPGKALLDRARAAAVEEKKRAVGIALDAAVAFALDTTKNAAEGANKLRALVEKGAGDPGLASRRDAIKDAYAKARARAFREDPALLLHGAKAKVEKGVLTATYEWKDASAARDWIVDADCASGSLKIDPAKASALVEGHVRHVARLTGRVKVKATVASIDAASPNVNLVLQDQGSRSGILVGIGWRPKDLASVTLPKNAAVRGGQTVPLPAIAVLLLDPKKKPSEWRVESAESVGDDVAPPGRRLKLDVTREDALLRVRLNGTTVVDLSPAPLPLQIGGVGFAPETSGLVLHEVTLEGKLDAGWLEGQIGDQAAAEAAALVK